MRAFIVAITLSLASCGSAAAQQDEMRPPSSSEIEAREPRPRIIPLCVMLERVSTPNDRPYIHIFGVQILVSGSGAFDSVIEVNTNGMQLVQRSLTYSPLSPELDRQYESQTELLRAALIARVVVEAYVNQYNFIEKLQVGWGSRCAN